MSGATSPAPAAVAPPTVPAGYRPLPFFVLLIRRLSRQACVAGFTYGPLTTKRRANGLALDEVTYTDARVKVVARFYDGTHTLFIDCTCPSDVARFINDLYDQRAVSSN